MHNILYFNDYLNNWERIVKLKGYDAQREQLLHPSSIIELISFLRILLLKMFKVFADVKSGGNFHHNLGPRSGLKLISFKNAANNHKCRLVNN